MCVLLDFVGCYVDVGESWVEEVVDVIVFLYDVVVVVL